MITKEHNPTTEQISRFFKKIETVPECGCHFWLGKTNRNGYGVVAIGNKREFLAHRFAFLIAKGKIPSGILVLHNCDTPCCVNPDYLFLGTQADNTADMVAKGRNCTGADHPFYQEGHPFWGKRNHKVCTGASRANRGEGNGCAKLTEAQVQLALDEDWPPKRISEAYGVHYATALDLLRGRTWKHLHAK